MTKKIAIGCDHGGYELKEKLKTWLKKEGYRVKDFGTNSKESVDWPIYAIKTAEAVSKGEFEEAVLICTSGVGMSIAANRLPGVRASLCYNEEIAAHTKEHNDSNILCLGGGYLKKEEAIKILETWLKTKPAKQMKYKRRIEMLEDLTKPGCPGCF
jgi:ribose 5-phosphate isomerase B